MPYPSHINREVDRRAEEEVQRNFQQAEDCLRELQAISVVPPSLDIC